MRSKRIRRQISDDPNRWLLSYADFMTLLFAFFVVMYAISSVDLSKYKVVAKSVGYAFDSTSEISASSSLKSLKIISLKNSKPFSKKEKELDDEKDKLFNALNTNFKNLDPNFFTVRGYEGWYEIEIKASSLFDSGEASLSKNAIKEIKRLAAKLKNVKSPIIIEGYTDVIPIKNSKYASNWVLSVTRAAMVAQTIDEAGLKLKQLSAVGYGSQYPTASNRTPNGRNKNRRVVIVVSKDNYSQRLLNPLKSRAVISQEPNAVKNKTRTIKTMKKINTQSGGVIFTQSIEEREIVKDKKSKPQEEVR